MSPETARGELATPADEPARRRLRNQVVSTLHRLTEGLPSSLRGDALHAAKAADDLIRSLDLALAEAPPQGRDAAPPIGTAGLPGPTARSVVRPATRRGVRVDGAGLGLQRPLRRVADEAGTRPPGGAVLPRRHPDPVPALTPSDSRDGFARYFVDLAHVADRVVAVSRTSRDDYMAFLHEVGAPSPSPRHPLGQRHPHARAHGDLPAPQRPHEPHRDALRAPRGTIEARKNHELLHHLWDRLVATYGDETPPLVLVGMIGWGNIDLRDQMRMNRRVAGKIVLLSDLPDGDLFWLYEHCLFTLFPSHYEGWGLPVVESLALGTPRVMSDAPAVREATQGLVPTLDPLDFTAWLEQVESLAVRPHRRGGRARPRACPLSRHVVDRAWGRVARDAAELIGDAGNRQPMRRSQMLPPVSSTHSGRRRSSHARCWRWTKWLKSTSSKLRLNWRNARRRYASVQ